MYIVHSLPLTADLNESELILKGDKYNLKNFADNFPVDYKAGSHIHYDGISFPEHVSENFPACVFEVI